MMNGGIKLIFMKNLTTDSYWTESREKCEKYSRKYSD